MKDQIELYMLIVKLMYGLPLRKYGVAGTEEPLCFHSMGSKRMVAIWDDTWDVDVYIDGTYRVIRHYSTPKNPEEWILDKLKVLIETEWD